MTDYKLYPNLPSAPPEALGPRSAENPQVAYHLSIIQAKMQGLKTKEQMFKKKYERYTKILNRLKCLLKWNKCCNICHIRQASCKHGIGCSIYDWGDC